MILYFDVFITDEPFAKNFYMETDAIRSSGAAIYKMPSKTDITMYTLASYSAIKWSKVLIKYEIADKSKEEYFEAFARKLFPDAIIMRGRSDNQQKFLESIKILKESKDPWIFYAGNNDHPFIAAGTKTLDACLAKAEELKKDNRWVSVIYSHFTESLNTANKESPIYCLTPLKVEKICENEHCIAVRSPSGNYATIQILHIGLMEHLFSGKQLEGKRVIRLENASEVPVDNQVIVIPKSEICAHFDGYTHTRYSGSPIPANIVPPLFIPRGFFENDMRIAYGYNEYREGWVNINPAKEKYSFEDKIGGTDLKLDLDHLPLFWKSRITKIDVNSKADLEGLKTAYAKVLEKVRFPWKKKAPIFYRMDHELGFLRLALDRLRLNPARAIRRAPAALMQKLKG